MLQCIKKMKSTHPSNTGGAVNASEHLKLSKAIAEGAGNSTLYYAEKLPGSARSGIGRQILPTFVDSEEWEAAGAIVRDEPYDVHAISAYNWRDPAEGYLPKVVKDIWTVYVKTLTCYAESDHFALDMVGSGFGHPPEAQYRALVDSVEAQLGRTGLVILVS